MAAAVPEMMALHTEQDIEAKFVIFLVTMIGESMGPIYSILKLKTIAMALNMCK